ncbi:hypothetical protein KR054_012347, partial [Drosophila jambulina]
SLYCSNSNNIFGGAALLVHNSISHSQKTLNIDFDAVGISIQTKKNIDLISTYISPSQQFNLRNLENVLAPSTPHAIVLGDFNSWHPYWGST